MIAEDPTLSWKIQSFPQTKFDPIWRDVELAHVQYGPLNPEGTQIWVNLQNTIS